MIRVSRWIAAVVLAVVGPALPASALVQPALAVQKKPAVMSLRPTSGAWYRPDPLCSLPIGCGAIPLPRINPYPVGTLEVGAAGGRETARAFIGMKHLPSLASRQGKLELTIPLKTLPTDGSLAPQLAHVLVCVTYQAVPNVAAAYDGPAPVCLPSASTKYVAKPQPHLVANLHKIQANLVGAKGLAFLPALGTGKTLNLSNWQVAFATPGPRLTFHAVARIANRVTHLPKPKPVAHHGPAPGAGNTGGDIGSLPSEPLPGATTTTPSGSDQGPAVAPQQAHPTAATTRLVRIGYQYPAAWLLPIGLVLLIPFTLKSLTRDLTRR